MNDWMNIDNHYDKEKR